MHSPSYSFLLHLFGCNSALYYGNRCFVTPPLLTSKRMHSSSFAKLTRITVAWKHFCEPDADLAFLERLENSISTCS